MSRRISATSFIVSQISLLVVGLFFIGWMYFFLQTKADDAKILTSSKPITSPPASLTLTVDTPDDDQLNFKDTILISGRTEKNIQVLVSSDDHDMVVSADSNGNFSADFPLETGVNNVNVAVFDATGDNRTVSKTIYYSEDQI